MSRTLAVLATAAGRSRPSFNALGDDKAPAAPVSFIKDVAPILVQNCIACHNPRKSESKYIMTTFAQLAKGGQQGEDITLEPGDPDASRFVELLRPDGQPRMPYKQDPLPAEKLAADRALGQGRGEVRRRPAERGLDRRPPQDHAGRRPRVVPGRPCRSRPWRSAPTARRSPPRATTRSRSGRPADGALDRRLRGLAERVYEIAYSPDGKWLATASGDPGQFGAVDALDRRAVGRRQARPRPAGEHRQRLRRRLQPRQQAARRRRGRPRDPRLGGRVGQAGRPDRGPRRLGPRRRLQPRRQAARQRQPGQDVQGLRRRQEGVAGHLPRPRPDGLRRRLQPRRQARGQRRRGQPDPALERRRRRQAGPPDRRLRRPGLQAPVHARRQDARRLRLRQDARGHRPRQRRRRS